MTFNEKIKEEKVLCNIIRATAKISLSSSSKMNKYEYLAGREILPLQQHRIIEETKFTYSTWKKAFVKQTKTIEGQKIRALQS